MSNRYNNCWAGNFTAAVLDQHSGEGAYSHSHLDFGTFFWRTSAGGIRGWQITRILNVHILIRSLESQADLRVWRIMGGITGVSLYCEI